jgi:hypothetical protein
VTLPEDDLVYPVAGLLGEGAGATRDLHVGPVAVAAGDDPPLATPVEVFTAVREWKNGFR